MQRFNCLAYAVQYNLALQFWGKELIIFEVLNQEFVIISKTGKSIFRSHSLYFYLELEDFLLIDKALKWYLGHGLTYMANVFFTKLRQQLAFHASVNAEVSLLQKQQSCIKEEKKKGNLLHDQTHKMTHFCHRETITELSAKDILCFMELLPNINQCECEKLNKGVLILKQSISED